MYLLFFILNKNWQMIQSLNFQTCAGTILIAVNPYKELNIYGPVSLLLVINKTLFSTCFNFD